MSVNSDFAIKSFVCEFTNVQLCTYKFVLKLCIEFYIMSTP